MEVGCHGMDAAARGEEETCCVCLRQQERPVSAACGHAMCASCAAQHVWKSGASVSCPLCRARIRGLEATLVGERTVVVDFAGIQWTLALNPGERVERCFETLFGISPEHMKVIGKGGKRVDDLESLVKESKANKFKLVGTPFAEQLKETRAPWSARLANQAKEWTLYLWSLCVQLLQLALLFFQTMFGGSFRAEHQAEQRAWERQRQHDRID